MIPGSDLRSSKLMDIDAPPPTPQNAGGLTVRPDGPKHEDTDVDPLTITLFGGALAGLVLGVLAASVLLFRGFVFGNDKLAEARPRQETGAASLVRPAPDYAGPLLQAKPEEDLKAMRANNAGDLDNYGWIDRNSGSVRLPIERAMELIVQRGLPPVSPGMTLQDMQRQRVQPEVYRQNLPP